jgi:hypothetical protein
MKKIIGLSSFAILLFAAASCGSDKTTKEVIVVPAQPKTIVIEKEPTTPNTVITLDKKGVKVEAKKVGVTIKN